FEDRNPANTGELVGLFPASTNEDVIAAVDAAREAFEAWRLTPAPKRAEILYRAAETLVRRKEDLARDMTREMGKVLAETRGGVVNVVNGSGPDVGAPLVSHPGVAAVSFTGSTEVGRLVSEACAPDFKPCHLEMGGKNILMVMEDANLELAVEGAVWAGFGT